MILTLFISRFLFFLLFYHIFMNTVIQQLENKGQGSVQLDLDYQPGIALVTIDNPKRHNALSGKMMVEFYQIVTQLEANTKDIVAVIVQGGGSPIKSFCAGLGTLIS